MQTCEYWRAHTCTRRCWRRSVAPSHAQDFRQGVSAASGRRRGPAKRRRRESARRNSRRRRHCATEMRRAAAPASCVRPRVSRRTRAAAAYAAPVRLRHGLRFQLQPRVCFSCSCIFVGFCAVVLTTHSPLFSSVRVTFTSALSLSRARIDSVAFVLFANNALDADASIWQHWRCAVRVVYCKFTAPMKRRCC